LGGAVIYILTEEEKLLHTVHQSIYSFVLKITEGVFSSKGSKVGKPRRSEND